MKRFFSVLLCIITVALAFTGCSDKNDETRIVMQGDINAASLVHLMEKAEQGKSKLDYTFETVYNTKSVAARMVNDRADIAVVPANVAAMLYNKLVGKATLYGITYMGDFYLLENGNTINRVADLKGKEICFAGQNTSLEYMFKYILKKNGIDKEDVTVSYVEDEEALTKGLADKSINIAVCTQGVKSVAIAKNSSLRSVMNLKTEWDFITEKSGYVEGCIIVNNNYAEKNKSQLKTFLKEVEPAVNLVKTDLSATASLCVKHEIFETEEIAKNALKASEISFVSGKEMMTEFKSYVNALHTVGLNTMGQKAPGNNFYYNVD